MADDNKVLGMSPTSLIGGAGGAGLGGIFAHDAMAGGGVNYLQKTPIGLGSLHPDWMGAAKDMADRDNLASQFHRVMQGEAAALREASATGKLGLSKIMSAVFKSMGRARSPNSALSKILMSLSHPNVAPLAVGGLIGAGALGGGLAGVGYGKALDMSGSAISKMLAKNSAAKPKPPRIGLDTGAINTPGSDTRKDYPGIAERVLTQTPGIAPKLKEEKELLELMQLGSGGSKGSLSGTQIQLGYGDPLANYSRIFKNPRTSYLGKGLGAVLGLPQLLKDPNQPTGPYYDVLADVAVTPWKARGATAHELGHAIDFNAGEVPKTWLGRQGKGLLRDLYTFTPGTTLWKEHAAWRKGRETAIQGAVKSKMKPKKLEKLLTEMAHGKAPALGTYWGGTLGAGAGVGAILAAHALSGTMKAAPLSIGPMLSAAGLGAGAGALTGLGIGTLLRNRNKEKEKEFVKDDYQKMLKNEARQRQLDKKKGLKAASTDTMGRFTDSFAAFAQRHMK